MTATARAPRKSFGRLGSLMQRSFALAWQADWRIFSATAALQLFGGLLLAAQVLIIKVLLDAIIASQQPHHSIQETIWPVAVLAVVMAFSTVATASQGQWQRLLAELVGRATWQRILDVATSVRLREFESSAFYDRLQRVQANAVGRPYMLTQAIVGLVGATASAVALALTLVSIQPLLLPLLLIAGVPMHLAGRLGSRMEFGFTVAQTPRLRLRQYLLVVQTGRDEAKEVRAFGLRGALRERFDAVYDAYVADLRGHVRRRSSVSAVSSLASAVVVAVTLFALVWLVGRGRLSLASAGAALVAVRMLSQQLTGMFSNGQQIFESGLFLDDLDDFLSLCNAAREEDEHGAPAPSMFSTIDVDGVGFTYPGSTQPALNGVSLQLRRGEVVALVGENGSGKTTLAKLLAGLYECEAGAIRWDGVDISAYRRTELQEHISVIFQDFVRYQLSVRDNIGFGRAECAGDPDRVARSARQARADLFIQRLDQGYETVLSKMFADGHELSVGQWQRVALARAFFRDAPFVILDEPSAALDPRSEHELFESLRELLSDRTVLFVSHRLSTVRNADRIYVLHRGEVVEGGSHDELMVLGGRYHDLFTLQAQGYLDPSPAGDAH